MISVLSGRIVWLFRETVAFPDEWKFIKLLPLDRQKLPSLERWFLNSFTILGDRRWSVYFTDLNQLLREVCKYFMTSKWHAAKSQWLEVEVPPPSPLNFCISLTLAIYKYKNLQFSSHHQEEELLLLQPPAPLAAHLYATGRRQSASDSIPLVPCNNLLPVSSCLVLESQSPK